MIPAKSFTCPVGLGKLVWASSVPTARMAIRTAVVLRIAATSSDDDLVREFVDVAVLARKEFGQPQADVGHESVKSETERALRKCPDNSSTARPSISDRA